MPRKLVLEFHKLCTGCGYWQGGGTSVGGGLSGSSSPREEQQRFAYTCLHACRLARGNTRASSKDETTSRDTLVTVHL